MTFNVDGLTSDYGTQRVLHGLSFRLEPGVTALLGANAAGKSTLLKCLAGLHSSSGQVTLGGRPLASLSRQELARRGGYLPQAEVQGGRLTVFETVLLGRVHDLGWRVSQSEIDRVRSLLDEMSLTHLAGRMVHQLSGGQAKLVALCQSLIRDPPVLLLDEPTSNLDLRRQCEICDRICGLVRSRGIIVLMSLHDLNLAGRYADRFLVLRDGRIYAEGTAAQVLTSEMMADVYGVDADIHFSASGFPVMTVRGPRVETAGFRRDESAARERHR